MPSDQETPKPGEGVFLGCLTTTAILENLVPFQSTTSGIRLSCGPAETEPDAAQDRMSVFQITRRANEFLRAPEHIRSTVAERANPPVRAAH